MEAKQQKRLEEIRQQHIHNAALATQKLSTNEKASEARKHEDEKVIKIKNALDNQESLDDLFAPVIPGVGIKKDSLSDKREWHSPLQVAAIYADVELMRDILKRGRGVRVNGARSQDGRTALHEICDSSSANEDICCLMANLLLESGADTEARTLDLHWSADGEAKDGAVPVQLIGGRTSLHLAAERGYFKLCSLLVKFGAEPLVWDNDGATPADLWLVNKHPLTDEVQNILFFSVYDCLVSARKGIDPESIRLRAKNSRERITRRRAAEKARLSRETMALILREFDWEELNIFDPERVLNPKFLRAVTHYESTGELGPLRLVAKDLNLPPFSSDTVVPEYAPCTVLAFTILSEDFCAKLNIAVERFYIFLKDKDISLRRGGSRYGFVFNDVGWKEFFDRLVLRYVSPLAKACYPDSDLVSFVDQHSFLVMYHPQTELRQHTHVDDCQLTVNVCLGKEGFKGGDLFFYGRRSELDGKPPPPRNIDGAKPEEKPYWRYEHVRGAGIFHYGDQYHGAEDIAEGERWNLIIWCRRVPKSSISPLCSQELAPQFAVTNWKEVINVMGSESLLPVVRFWLDLVKDGRANINQVDTTTGVTLLHYCTIVNDIEALSVLLQAKLDTNVYDKSGFTPLHQAVSLNGIECTRLLLEHGANINALTLTTKQTRIVSITVAGQTPLHIAGSRVPLCLEMVQLLLDRGADVNLVDSKGNMPKKILQ
jgi:ankyrin repeat protein